MQDSFQILTHRQPLLHAREALLRRKLRIGFIGGSITEDIPYGRGFTNWPEGVIAWFLQQYPDVDLDVESVGIGATGTDLAVFRARRDLIDRECDLIFVEFAVNDNGIETERRNKTREGLLRQLLRSGQTDVVLVYTFCQDMYADIQRGVVPASIAEFELLAEHYKLGSAWVGLNTLLEVEAGQLRWEEWLPDGLHPHSLGSSSYARCVGQFLQHELNTAESPASVRPLPPTLYPGSWEHARLLPLTEIERHGPWALRRSTSIWFDQVLRTAAPGSSLSFSFTGTGLVFAFNFGKSSAEFRYRINGGEWQTSVRERPNWCPDTGWIRIFVVGDALPLEEHYCEIEVIHGDRAECTGTNFDLGFVGILG